MGWSCLKLKGGSSLGISTSNTSATCFVKRSCLKCFFYEPPHVILYLIPIYFEENGLKAVGPGTLYDFMDINTKNTSPFVTVAKRFTLASYGNLPTKSPTSLPPWASTKQKRDMKKLTTSFLSFISSVHQLPSMIWRPWILLCFHWTTVLHGRKMCSCFLVVSISLATLGTKSLLLETKSSHIKPKVPFVEETNASNPPS